MKQHSISLATNESISRRITRTHTEQASVPASKSWDGDHSCSSAKREHPEHETGQGSHVIAPRHSAIATLLPAVGQLLKMITTNFLPEKAEAAY